jgi:hypothetical protein
MGTVLLEAPLLADKVWSAMLLGVVAAVSVLTRLAGGDVGGDVMFSVAVVMSDERVNECQEWTVQRFVPVRPGMYEHLLRIRSGDIKTCKWEKR